MLTRMLGGRFAPIGAFLTASLLLGLLLGIGGLAAGTSMSDAPTAADVSHAIVGSDHDLESPFEWTTSESLVKTDATAFHTGAFLADQRTVALTRSGMGLSALHGPLLFATAPQNTDGDWSTVYGQSASAQSATVVDDVVYVVSDESDGSWIHAVDAETGDERWSQPLAGSQISGGHAPTVVNGTVYVGGHWHLHAFDAETGEEAWEEYVGSIRTSPTVYDEYVLVGTARGSLRSVDAGNGSQVWSYTVDDEWASVDSWGQSEHSSVTVVDGIVYATGGTEIHALELSDPAEQPEEPLWTWETANEGSQDDQITGALTVLEDTAFVHVNTFEGHTVTDGQAHRLHSSNLLALDLTDGSEEWMFEVDHPGTRGTSSPTAVSDQGDGTVYFHANDDVLYAVDADDGSINWHEPNLHSSFATSSPTVTEDRVYVGSNTFDNFGNGVFVVDRQTGIQVDFHSTGDYRVTSSAIVVDGVLYGTGSWLVPPSQADGGKLFAVNVADDGSSIGSRTLQATLNHHDYWTGAHRGDVAVVDATLEQDAILQHESMSVDATFHNFGSTSVDHNATLRIGDYQTLYTTYAIDGYSERQEILSSPVTETGTYDVSLDGVDLGTLHVVDPNEPVYMAEAALVDDVVWVERDIEVEATFENIGELDVEIATRVTANGTEIANEFISVDGDESETIVLAGHVSDPGTYDIAIDDTHLGTVEVLDEPTYLVEGSIVNERILVEEPVDVDLVLRNLAEHPETHEATLAVEGVTSTETEFTLDGHEETTKAASVPVDETGTYKVTYGGADLGGVSVLADAVNLLDVELVDRDPPIAAPGESVEVRLYYENVASSDREHDITITADDDPVVEESVTLEAHDREMITLNITDLEEGVYDLAVDDEPIERLYVGDYDHFIFQNDSIESVLDNATADDRLGVAQGVYEESLTVDIEGISISNFAGEEPVLEGNFVEESGVEVLAADFSLEGFAIANYTTGIQVGDIPPPESIAAPGFELRDTHITGTERAVWLRDADDSTIVNNTLTANRGPAIESHSNSNIDITGNTITENAGHGIVDQGTNPDHWIISDNYITNNSNGGVFTNLVDSEISQNQVSNNDGGGIAVNSRNNVTDNTVVGNGNDHVTMTGGIRTLTDTVIANNTVSDVDGTGIEPSARSLVWNNTVSDAGTLGIEIGASDAILTENVLAGHEADIRFTTGAGTFDNATVTNNTLETGIDFIADEGLIYAPHTIENNTVNGAPIYYAADTSDPTIDPDAGQIIMVNVTNADISGFTFENVVAGIQLSHVSDSVVRDNEIRHVETRFLDDSGVLGVWHSSFIAAKNNTIEDVDRTGIQIHDSIHLTLAENHISNVSERGIRVVGVSAEQITIEANDISGASTGIEASGNDDGVVTQNYLANTVTGIVHVGDRATVGHNTVEESNDLGISVSGDELEVTQNTVTDSEGDGLRVSGREGTIVSRNTVTGSDGLGLDIEVDDAGSIVAKNTVRANEDGMYLSGPGVTDLENIEIVTNTIADNSNVGIQVDGDQGVMVSNNSITGNGDGLLYTGGIDVLNATNNWWGSSDGPSGDVSDPVTGAVANGTGDSIETGVGGDWISFDPWIDVSPTDSSLAQYANEDDVIDTDGLRDAVEDWRAGDIDTNLLRDVVEYWRSGKTVGTPS